LNFPVRLNNKVAALLTAIEGSDTQPTAAQQQVYEELASAVNAEIRKMKQAVDVKVPALNKAAKDEEIPAVSVKSSGAAQ
jgi:hypothetical protein